VILLFALAGVAAPLLLGIFAAMSVALTLLYLLREQHRPLVVPFVELWRRILEKRRASAPWQRLRRLLSLLLQLTLLALLLLALGDPRSDAEAERARTVVLLVDVSPSMETRLGGKTRLDIAKERLREWVDTLGQRDRAIIVSLSARPRVETGLTNDRRVLLRAISSLSIKHSAANLSRGLRLAREIVPTPANADIIVLGDGAYADVEAEEAKGLPLSFEPIAIGSAEGPALENVGISNFSARRFEDEPRRFEAQLELNSTAKASVEVEIVLSALDPTFARGRTLEVQRAILPPAGHLLIPLAELRGASEGVVAEVRRVDGGSDFLEADNRAQLLLLPLPPLRVLISGPPNQFLDAALLTEPDVVTYRLGEAAPTPEQTPDVVIHDGPPRPAPASHATLYLGPPDDGAPFPLRLGRKLRGFGFDRWQKDSPLFDAVDPYDVQALEGRALLPGPKDKALAFSGQDPIVVMGERPEGRFVAVGFDPKQSDFFLRAAWPLFLHNTLWELAPRVSGEDGVALSPGRQWHLRTPRNDPSAELRGPLGQPAGKQRRVAVTEQRTAVFGELAGFYEIAQGDGSRRFVANYFDEAEAQLLPKATISIESSGSVLSRPRAPERPNEWTWWLVLLGVALALSFSEWWSYHRRWTV